MATQMRVRSILDSLTKEERAKLKKLIPKAAHKAPAALTTNAKYPSIFISVLPDGEGYGLLGHIAEEMVRIPYKLITVEMLMHVTKEVWPELTDADQARLLKSKTIPPFLENLKGTRKILKDKMPKGVEEIPELEINAGSVQGHPDIVCGDNVFEIKLAGQPAKDWISYVYQVFAYGAILPETKTLHLVFPLHQHVETFDISEWKGRGDYLAVLQAAAVRGITVMGPAAIKAAELCCSYCIGSHVEKRGSLINTLSELDVSKPWQIFLSNPMSTRFSIKDDDLALTSKWVESNKANIYVHTPYLINLSSKEEYNVKCLQECLEIAVAAGFRGVVVHVGKAGKTDVAEAVETMRNNLLAALPSATTTCPILLETPSGQGTETLTDYAEFVGFVKSFDDPRLRVCIDTCHIFSCGWDPYAYINDCLKDDPSLLHLIHFNDSATEAGSKLDRHAPIGTGHIGFEKLTLIAELAKKYSVPCLVE